MLARITLGERKLDAVFIAFFLANLLAVTYAVSIEQLLIPDPYNFIQPPWPPAALVDAIHAYGDRYDPLLMARPLWWKVFIAWDVFLFGPFYALATFAYWTGRSWIRLPSIVYASALLAIMSVILVEELYGPHATAYPGIVLSLNAPWVIMPVAILIRMVSNERPFLREQPETDTADQWSL